MLPWTLRRWLGLADPERDESLSQPETPRPPNVAYHHDLAMAVRNAPNDDAPLEAYGQWLAENNDPRSALIRQALDGAPASIRAEHEVLFLGPLFEVDDVEVTWARGFWDQITVRREWDAEQIPGLLRTAFDHPSALLLRSLRVEADCVPALADMLADGPVLPLRSLEIDSRGGPMGAWAAVWARLPDLKELVFRGARPQLGELALPLRRVVLEGPLTADALWSVAKMNAPDLEHLVLDPSADAQAAAAIRDRFGAVLTER